MAGPARLGTDSTADLKVALLQLLPLLSLGQVLQFPVHPPLYVCSYFETDPDKTGAPSAS